MFLNLCFFQTLPSPASTTSLIWTNASYCLVVHLQTWIWTLCLKKYPIFKILPLLFRVNIWKLGSGVDVDLISQLEFKVQNTTSLWTFIYIFMEIGWGWVTIKRKGISNFISFERCLICLICYVQVILLYQWQYCYHA